MRAGVFKGSFAIDGDLAPWPLSEELGCLFFCLPLTSLLQLIYFFNLVFYNWLGPLFPELTSQADYSARQTGEREQKTGVRGEKAEADMERDRVLGPGSPTSTNNIPRIKRDSPFEFDLLLSSAN